MKLSSIKTTLSAGVSALMLVSCAPMDAHKATAEDPYEPFNRQMFAFNEVLDTVLLKPIAQVYRFVVPEVGRKAVSNALQNFYEPVTMMNAFLQGDVDRGFTSFWRFTLNTTLGGAGIYDFAHNNTELKYRPEDFGQTIGVWSNNADSNYLVLPIFGPSTTRDAVGRVADIGLNPWTYALKTGESIGVGVANGIVARENALDLVDEIYANSFDPYATIRSAYLQRRSAQILNTHNPESSEK